MAGLFSAIVEKVFGSAIEKAVARKVAEGAVKAEGEKVAAAVTTDTVAVAAGTAAKAESIAVISSAAKPASEVAAPGRLSRIWNTGRAKDATWPSWAAGILGRGTAKLIGAGLAYEAAVHGGPPLWDEMTKKRPDAAQAPYDAKATESQTPRVEELRKSIVKGDRPGSAPLVVPAPATNQPISPEDAARRNLAERKASSKAATDVAANVAIDAAAGPPGVAELRGASTWGKYLASVKDGGARQLAYENASPAGRAPMLFRNSEGVEVRVVPRDNVFIVNDPRVLTPRAGTSVIEIDIYRLQTDGSPRGGKFDTIKIDKFPTLPPGPQRRGDVPTRRPGVQPG